MLGLLYLYFFFYSVAAGVFTSEQLYTFVLGLWSAFALVWWVRSARILLRAWRRRYRRLWLIPIVGVVWALLGPLAAIPIFVLWLRKRRKLEGSTVAAATGHALLGVFWLGVFGYSAFSSESDAAAAVWLSFSLLWWARGTWILVRRWSGDTHRLWLVPVVTALWSVLGPLAAIPLAAGWLWRRRKSAAATAPVAGA